MYSVIRNMGHTKWLLGAAALALLFAGGKHMWTVHNMHTEYSNRPLARSLNMVMASVKPAHQSNSLGQLDWNSTIKNVCDTKELTRLEAGLARLDTELALVTGDPSAVVAKNSSGNRKTDKAYVLNRQSLNEVIQLAVLENDDGQEFRCATLVTAVEWLLRKNGSSTRVSLINWREQDLGRPGKQANPSDGGEAQLGPEHHRAEDPWGDLPGCILMSDAEGYMAVPPSNDKASAQLCKGAFVDGNLRMVPRNLMPAGTEHIRAALASVAPKEKYAGNMVEVLGHATPQGPHYLTTLNATEHGVSQQAANCYTGDKDACQALGIDDTRWKGRYEKAAVRMAGVLVMDVQTGAIEAAGSAHTKCFTQEYDGPGRDADCLHLPTEPRSRPYALENHALYTSYMPGSLVKPILAMGLLTDQKLAARLHGVERNQFLNEIRRSNTPAFLDRLFCKDKGFKDCPRPGYAFDAATALGWNGNCGDGSDKECARIGRFTGADDESFKFFTGMMGIKHDAQSGSYRRQDTSFDAETAKECSMRPGELAWRRCKGAGKDDHLLELESEAWGQGSAQATPVGIATMLSRLGATANQRSGTISMTAPHLFQSAVITRDGKPTAIPVNPVRAEIKLNPRDAELVLSGMAQSHLPQQGALGAGTASSACIQVYGSATACAALTHVAGKTGTPPFTHDRFTVATRLESCNKIREGMTKVKDGRWTSLQSQWVDCQHRPIKWYAALLKNPNAPEGPWTKAIVVIVERNWGLNGVIDSPGDTGPNTAAELAFQVIKRIAPTKPTSTVVALTAVPVKK